MTCTNKKTVLFIVLVTLIMCFTGLAGGMEMQPFQLSAQWTDEWAQPQTAIAQPIPYAGYENSYWLQLPQGVMPGQAALYIQDNFGACASYSVANGTLLEGVMDAGSDLATALPLEITGFDMNGQPVLVLRLYVSTQMPLPQDPYTPAPVQPVDVIIRYLDASTYAEIATATTQTVYEGNNTVVPAPFDLQANYNPTGEQTANVFVDYNGANPAEVSFFYEKAAVQPVDVIIRYLDASTYAEIATATTQTVYEGNNTVVPAPYDLQANYNPTGEQSANVFVDYNGANPAEVSFFYEKAAVQPVDVIIRYLDAATYAEIATATSQTVYEGNNTVVPAPFDLQANYNLTGEQTVNVFVDYNGANPAEVSFFYEKAAVQPVDVIIRYLDAATYAEIATATTQTVYEGNNTVVPAPFDLQANYNPTGEQTVNVFVDYNGANPAEVSFFYEKAAVQPVDVIIRYLDASTYAEIATATTQTVYEGNNTVVPAPYDLQANYNPTGEQSANVFVDYNGANPAEVSFFYEKAAVQPVDVIIRYLDASTYAEIATATTQTVYEGNNTVVPAPYDLQANYDPTGEQTANVFVDYNGANPAEVSFFYEKAAVQPVDVIIRYLDASTYAEIATATTQTVYEGNNTVVPAPYDLQANYNPTGEQTANVFVDYNGASPAEVTFYYTYEAPATPIPTEVPATEVPPTPAPTEVPATEVPPTEVPVQPVTLPIHYLDIDTDAPIATQGSITCQPGTVTDVFANPSDLLSGYVPADENQQVVQVTVDEMGFANLTEVVFYYQYITPETPAPTDVPPTDVPPTDVPPTQEPAQPIELPILYLDVDTGYPVATDSTVICQPGMVTDVFAAPSDLLSGYVPADENQQMVQVYVDEMGNANIYEVVFYYRYVTPETPAPTDVPPTDVPATDVPATDVPATDVPPTDVPETPVPETPAPTDIPATPIPTDAPIVEGMPIDRWGRTNAKVNFRSSMQAANSSNKIGELKKGTQVWVYKMEIANNEQWYQVMADGRQGYLMAEFVDVLSQMESDQLQSQHFPMPTTSPTPVPVLPQDVVIRYVDSQTLSDIASPTTQTVYEGSNTVIPAPYDLPEHYFLSGEGAQNVWLDAAGMNPQEIIFYYTYQAPATQAPILPAVLPIVYQDMEGGQPVALEGTITLDPGTVTEVYPAPEGLLENYVPARQSPLSYTVTVDNMGIPTVNGQQVYDLVFYYVYQAPATPAPLQPMEITIQYFSTDGYQIADATRFTLQPGENTVTPGQPLTEGDWELQGEGYVPVTLDDQGPSMDPVIFYYEKAQPAPTLPPMPVTIRYVDQQGNSLRPDENVFLPAGETPITAPDILDDAYVLEGENTRVIHVDEYGANPSLVIFTYRTSQAAPKVALVTVKYADESGSTLFATYQQCIEGQENPIRPDYDALIQQGFGNYVLSSPGEVPVTVDGNGVATPAEVVFTFAKPVEITPTLTPTDVPTPTPEVPVNVPVYFRNQENVDIAPSQQIPCYVGSNIIEANPMNLLPGYKLQGDAWQTVVLSPEGQLSPIQVVFTYVSSVTQAPVTASPFPYQYQPMDAWCYPESNNINFRSEPNQNCDVIRVLRSTELGHISGLITFSENDQWYMVTLKNDGTFGFLKTTVARVLTDREVEKLFGYTPVPPTPSPSPIPEGFPIDRWAATNAKVFFRSSMEAGTNSNKLGELKKNTQLWVFKRDSMEGKEWYHVMVDGQEGYIMAEFVDLMSQTESDRIQAQHSPMPTTSPTPTPYVPTPAPSAPPTETPIPTQAPTETPPPYAGYALTLYQLPLRTGVTDDTILEWLPADTLVYINGQTYVAGESWSSLRTIRSGNYGFIQHSALLPITNEQAEPYLDMIAQWQATATPEPEQQYGFAMTLGDGVPLRSFADTNAEIMLLMPYGAVASVRGQIFAGDTTWHLVQYNGMWGYVRADQMRMMSEEEVIAYQQSLEKGTPVPTESPATPPPITEESLSSYGHVQSNSGKVNLRSAPSTDSTPIRLLNNYAFALVMGTEIDQDGKTWYHVSQAGTEGYIHGDYFKVLTLSELTLFLQSSEYQNANSENSQTGSSSGQIQPVEDYNQTVWQNPALSASYEPFNPWATPTPDPERLPTASPTVRPTATITSTPVIAPIQGGFTPTPDQSGNGGSVLPWLLLGAAVLGGGGAVYAYSIHQQNERRRQAVRAQQARQAAAMRQQQAQQPQMRMAPTQATRSYPSPYAPTGNGQQVPPQPTSAYKPPVSHTGAYAPVRNEAPTAPREEAPVTQATQAYTAPQKESDAQATQAYNPASTQTPTPRKRRGDKYNS